MPGTVLGTGDTGVHDPVLNGVYILVGKMATVKSAEATV